MPRVDVWTSRHWSLSFAISAAAAALPLPFVAGPDRDSMEIDAVAASDNRIIGNIFDGEPAAEQPLTRGDGDQRPERAAGSETRSTPSLLLIQLVGYPVNCGYRYWLWSR